MAHENETNEDVSSGTGLLRFERGELAYDRDSDDESEVLVLYPQGKSAEQCYISAIDQTVAEANPEYPSDDPVFSVAFVESIEASLGIDWEPSDVIELAGSGELTRARIKTYAYPESRLASGKEESDA